MPAKTSLRKGTAFMVKRLITAAIGIPIGIFVLYLNNKDLMAGVTAILSVAAVYEILSVRKYTAHKAVSLTAMVFSFILPLMFCYEELRESAIFIAFLFLILMFCAMLVNHHNVSFEEIGLVSFTAICVPLSISTLAFFMFRYEEYGVFIIVFTLVTTWMADGGAYFAGTFFGKHKLASEISPKKTWEGLVGGVICSSLSGALCGWGYELLTKWFGSAGLTFRVNIPILLVTGFFVAWIGLLGDLSMSLLKRQSGVKDFGNLLPGHGGIMDRFDSVVFTAPFVYLVFQLFFPISAI